MKTIEEKAAQIVARAQIITVASVDENGYPRPVPIVKLKAEEGGAIYFSTGTSSAKTAHFRANPKAGISIVEEGNSVVYTGEIEIVADEAVKRALWGDWMKEHFPLGVDDPEYCVLKFTPRSSTFWIDNAFVKDGKRIGLFCQSCGMPLQTPELFGTEKDGSANEDYCKWCYADGAFVQECTMEGMIDHCLQFLDQMNGACGTKLTPDQARAQMQAFFPTLKRWKV